MKRRITLNWITDDQYLLPTLLSITSLYLCDGLDGVDLCLHYAGEGAMDALTRTVADKFSGAVRISVPELELPKSSPKRESPQIRNRLARIAIMHASDDSWSGLIDSDVFFAAPLSSLLLSLPQHGTWLAGVEEFPDARKAYLYTRPPGYQFQDVPGFEANAVIAQELRLHGITPPLPQFNNGLLLFRACPDLAKHWRCHYQTVLDDDRRNPEDDQVPLALATATSSTALLRLPKRFNSLGILNGQYAAYHAWLGSWQEELLASLPPAPIPSSDCGKILRRAYQHLGRPETELLPQVECATPRPWRYAQIEGNFSAVNSYRQAVAKDNFTVFAELGCVSKGRSTMFLAESINLRPDSARCSLSVCSDGLSVAEVTDMKTSLYNAPIPVIWTENVAAFGERSVDVVFLDTERYLSSLSQVLVTVVKVLRNGGLCIGTDLGGKLYEREFQRYLRTFCAGRSLALMFNRSRFVMGSEEATMIDCI